MKMINKKENTHTYQQLRIHFNINLYLVLVQNNWKLNI